MDRQPELREQRPEEIRHHIDETRCDLTAKLEALEQKVKGTVADARSAVIDTVKQSVDRTVHAVQGTVDSVKHALDLRAQVQGHPWGMLAGSMVAGFALEHLVSHRHPVSRTVTQSPVAALPPQREADRRLRDFHSARTVCPPAPPPVAEPRVPERGLFSELTDTFAPEIQKLKSLAIGTLMALTRDSIVRSVAPPLGAELERVLDRVTTKLGGVPLSNVAVGRACATNGTQRQRERT
jgi:hypothetical protein